MAYTRSEFINIVAPHAVQDMVKTKILASLTIAQAILESGNGNSGLTQKANNLFGIKAGSSWKGKTITLSTREVINGKEVYVDAAFRSYSSWLESINDHSALLTNATRYIKLINEKDYKLACKYIQEAGYATDPNYTTQLINLIQAHCLYEYDQIAFINPNNFISCLH